MAIGRRIYNNSIDRYYLFIYLFDSGCTPSMYSKQKQTRAGRKVKVFKYETL